MARRLTVQRAVKIACESIDAELQKLAPDANLYEHYHADSGKRAFERREKLREAKRVLVNLADHRATQLGLWSEE